MNRNFSVEARHAGRRPGQRPRRSLRRGVTWEEEIMRKDRIGTILGRLAHLSEHDIEEILQDQNTTRQRFGEIALLWGLCKPEHIWQAWCTQLTDGLERVELAKVGIDAQAVPLIPRELAHRFHAIAIRKLANELVVAIVDPAHQQAIIELPRALGKKIKFVLTDAAELDRALASYYPNLQAAG